jgi:3-oxoacyl-[acyl-carrier protein] reductase
MESLAGKCALITGGCSGIGAALAVCLSTLGANVAVNYLSDSQAGAAEELVQKVSTKSAGIAVKGDASTVSGVDGIVKAVVEQFQRIDILVCMAGVLAMRDLAATTEQDFDDSYAVNVKGPYFLAQVRFSLGLLDFSPCRTDEKVDRK